MMILFLQRYNGFIRCPCDTRTRSAQQVSVTSFPSAAL